MPDWPGALTTCRGDGRCLETVGPRVLTCFDWHTRQAYAREVQRTWKVYRTGRGDHSLSQPRTRYNALVSLGLLSTNEWSGQPQSARSHRL